jgi:hypothetical protein
MLFLCSPILQKSTNNRYYYDSYVVLFYYLKEMYLYSTKNTTSSLFSESYFYNLRISFFIFIVIYLYLILKTELQLTLFNAFWRKLAILKNKAPNATNINYTNSNGDFDVPIINAKNINSTNSNTPISNVNNTVQLH